MYNLTFIVLLCFTLVGVAGLVQAICEIVRNHKQIKNLKK